MLAAACSGEPAEADEALCLKKRLLPPAPPPPPPDDSAFSNGPGAPAGGEGGADGASSGDAVRPYKALGELARGASGGGARC